MTRWQLTIGVSLVRGLNPTPQGTSWRQPCNTCTGYTRRQSPGFHRVNSSMSNPGKVLRVASNWATSSTACVSPRQFLWVSALRPYSPGGALNGFPSAATGRIRPLPSAHRLRRGLPGYLILFATHAFAPQRQKWTRDSPSPPVFLSISTHFTAPPRVPVPPTTL